MEKLDEVRPKLLLADDSLTTRKVVELSFADKGIDVSAVADAESAMLKFVEIQPDIVLVDVGLEGTSGYQICEMIKNDEATKHLPVLLLVGSFEPFDQDEAERVKADGFLKKPFHSTRDLVARISDLLGRSNGVDAVSVETAYSDPVLTGDIDNLYNSSLSEPVNLDKLDTMDDLLSDAGMDDEMIATSYPSEPFGESILAFERAGERTAEFDWSKETKLTDVGPIQKAQASFEPKFVFEDEDIHRTIAMDQELGIRTLEDIPAVAENTGDREPSAELIELITRRVIERLSDHAIREIAQEAVPRIAEKLIREALKEEKE